MTTPARCTDRSTLLNRLKEWLRERQGSYVHVNDWCGDTEGGFYTETTFDFDDLCKQIDEFGEELRDKEQPTATNGSS